MEIQLTAETFYTMSGRLKKKCCPTCGTNFEAGYNSDTFWCPQCCATFGVDNLPDAVRASRVVGAFEKITPLYWLQNAGDIYHAKSDYISQRAAKDD